MISVDELTGPLTQDNPCGEDLSMGPSLIELDAMILGTPDRQFSSAEPPDWRKLREACLELFGRSRDLRVAVALCLAMMCTEGLGGLRDGLAILRNLLQKYWEPLHPRLDPEDNNDPLQRMNTLAVLAAPQGKDGDAYRFVERLQAVPLTNSRQIGRFTFGKLLEVREATAKGTPLAGGPDSAQVDAAFRDTPEEELKQTYRNAVEALEQLHSIGEYLGSTVGAANAPNLTELEKALAAIRDIVGPHIPSATPAAVAGSAPGANGGHPGGNGSGTVSSREDVLRVLKQVRTFYAQQEPASPIPLLIHRIERMVPMTFLEILKEMAPDSLKEVSTIVGSQPEDESK
jgi:type VI secretion system protein ImpA